ncbi:phytanoyl-CoA dioxygenase family protein [Micromonospora sp. CPCC 206061]|uniref:phytanoyl-CoA dioxygenase family protein n=1 Tax=Micromonospora sp. CPCC 206061 TaxID=3122410 RepID=UPI002FF1227C
MTHEQHAGAESPAPHLRGRHRAVHRAGNDGAGLPGGDPFGTRCRCAAGARAVSARRHQFRLAPELAWQERVTVPLRAGDCTFHNAYLAHTATPNLTDDPRIVPFGMS